MKELGYGKDYKYSHDYENHFVAEQFLPDQLKNVSIWKKQDNAAEKKMAEWLEKLWKNRYQK